MDWSCAVVLIAAVTNTGNVGVNVTREVVEEEHTTYYVCEGAESVCPCSVLAIVRSVFQHAKMAPLLSSCMNTVGVYTPNIEMKYSFIPLADINPTISMRNSRKFLRIAKGYRGLAH